MGVEGQTDAMQITINDLPVGRSVDETLRLIDAFQFTEKYGEVCPANWNAGDKGIRADSKPLPEKQYSASAQTPDITMGGEAIVTAASSQRNGQRNGGSG